MTVETPSQVRFIGDLSIDELADLVGDLGRQLTDCREGIRQAGQAAEQALAKRDMDGVARAVEQETELQQRLPNLDRRLGEAQTRLETLRQPMVEAELAKAGGLVQGWHDQQQAAVRRVEKATDELRAAVRDLREVGKGWDDEQRQAENRLAEVDPTGAVPRPRWTRPSQPDVLDMAVSIRTLAEQLGRWSIGRA